MQKGLKIQAWCAHVQWPGRDPFTVGNFYVEVGTRSREEILQLVEEEYKKGWGRCLPVDVPLPNIIKLIHGQIFFVPEEDWNESPTSK